MQGFVHYSIFLQKIYMYLIFLTRCLFYIKSHTQISMTAVIPLGAKCNSRRTYFRFISDNVQKRKYILIYFLLYSISIRCTQVQVQYYIWIRDVKYPLRYDLIKKGIIKIWIYVRPLFTCYTCIHDNIHALTRVSLINVYRFSGIYTSACQIIISMY